MMLMTEFIHLATNCFCYTSLDLSSMHALRQLELMAAHNTV